MTSLILFCLLGSIAVPITTINASTLDYNSLNKFDEKSKNPLSLTTISSPISLSKNSDFVDLGFPGSGTKIDPYIISNLQINASDPTSGIDIYNTTAFFEIQENEINSETNAIRLRNVTNAVIHHNVIDSGSVVVDQSKLINITTNNINQPSGFKTTIKTSSNITVANNLLVHLDLSSSIINGNENITIVKNNLTDFITDTYVLSASNLKDSIISFNSFSSKYGLKLSGTANNVTDNQFVSSVKILEIWATYSLIMRNNFTTGPASHTYFNFIYADNNQLSNNTFHFNVGHVDGPREEYNTEIILFDRSLRNIVANNVMYNHGTVTLLLHYTANHITLRFAGELRNNTIYHAYDSWYKVSNYAELEVNQNNTLLFFDDLKPKISISNKDNIQIGGAYATAKYYVSDESGFVNYQVNINGVYFGEGTSYFNNKGTISVTFSPYLYEENSLELLIIVTDKGNNTNEFMDTIDFIEDLSEPRIDVSEGESTVALQFPNPSSIRELEFLIYDNSVGTYEIYINDTLSLTDTFIRSSTVLYAPISFEPDICRKGVYIIVIIAIDYSGNVGSGGWGLIIDENDESLNSCPPLKTDKTSSSTSSTTTIKTQTSSTTSSDLDITDSTTSAEETRDSESQLNFYIVPPLILAFAALVLRNKKYQIRK